MSNQLEKAVVKQLGLSYTDVEEFRGTMENIRNNGIDGGFHGFIYYEDTAQFATENLDEIMDLVKDYASIFSDDGAYSLIADLVFKDDIEDKNADDVVEAIRDTKSDDHLYVMNWLAWFAAENVANSYDYA